MTSPKPKSLHQIEIFGISLLYAYWRADSVGMVRGLFQRAVLSRQWSSNSNDGWSAVQACTACWANKAIFTGDNLTIMRRMNSASVDLIYLDPPFNSNTNYAAPIGSKAADAEFQGYLDTNRHRHGVVGLDGSEAPRIKSCHSRGDVGLRHVIHDLHGS